MLRLDIVSALPSRIGAEYVECASRIGAERGAEFAKWPNIIRRALVETSGRPSWIAPQSLPVRQGYPGIQPLPTVVGLHSIFVLFGCPCIFYCFMYYFMHFCALAG